MRKPPVVFDVDGCIADTLPLVLEAYRAAGATGATIDHVRQHWTRWLPDLVGGQHNAESVRHRKTELYLRLLETRPPRRLPTGNLARELLDAGELVYVITAAHAVTTAPILRAIDLVGARVLGNEVLPDRRVEALDGLAPRGTYYDDDLETIWRVHAESEWSAIRV